MSVPCFMVLASVVSLEASDTVLYPSESSHGEGLAGPPVEEG